MKLLKKLALIVLLGFLGLGAAGYFLMPPAAKKAIEVGTQKALGTETQLNSISAGLGFTSTSMGVGGFTVDQPTGFEGPPLLQIGEMGFSVDTFSLLSNTIRVPEIQLDGLQLRLVQNGQESNFLRVYQSVRKLTEGDGTNPPPSEEAKDGKGVDIGVVKVAGVQASFDLTGIPGIHQSYSFDLPAFEIDLSQKANETRLQNVEQVTAKLMETLIEQTVARAKAELSPELAALVGGDVAGLKARVDSELNKIRQAAEGRVDQAKEAIRSKVGDEFGKQVEGALGKDAVDQAQDALQQGAEKALEGAKEKVLPGNTEDNLKKETDTAVKKGADDLQKKVGGLLGGKKPSE